MNDESREPRVGLVVNPVAGMGGRVGLKGTDGGEMLAEALRRGAEPVAPGHALRFLERLGDRAGRLTWLTCSGDMGADVLREAGLRGGEDYRVECHVRDLSDTGPEDTKKACEAFLRAGADLVVFCGGDGTARDVLDAVGDRLPALGVPAGVKMFSGVFAVSPEAAAEVLAAFADGEAEEGAGEVADVDEEAYRRGELAVRLYGTLRVLRVPALIQSMKHVGRIPEEGVMTAEIARYVVEVLEREGDPVTLLGAGSTVEAVARALGVEKTPLGVDVVQGRDVLVGDASEAQLLQALRGADVVRIVISPIGAQGFLLGRGNQQISPAVLEAAGGPAALIIVATPHKMRGLKVLQVDTGDAATDLALGGMRRVVVGYHDVVMARVVAASDPGG